MNDIVSKEKDKTPQEILDTTISKPVKIFIQTWNIWNLENMINQFGKSSPKLTIHEYLEGFSGPTDFQILGESILVLDSEANCLKFYKLNGGQYISEREIPIKSKKMYFISESRYVIMDLYGNIHIFNDNSQITIRREEIPIDKHLIFNISIFNNSVYIQLYNDEIYKLYDFEKREKSFKYIRKGLFSNKGYKKVFIEKFQDTSIKIYTDKKTIIYTHPNKLESIEMVHMSSKGCWIRIGDMSPSGYVDKLIFVNFDGNLIQSYSLKKGSPFFEDDDIVIKVSNNKIFYSLASKDAYVIYCLGQYELIEVTISCVPLLFSLYLIIL